MKTADKTRETPAFPKTFIMAMIFGVGLNPVNSTLISTALAPISHDLRIDAGSLRQQPLMPIQPRGQSRGANVHRRSKGMKQGLECEIGHFSAAAYHTFCFPA